MNKKRPINLDLSTLHFPVMAIISIMHRLAGIILFLLLPLMLYFLQLSLSSEISFSYLQGLLKSAMSKFLLWAFLSALSYHLLAGIRHLFMDIGFGEHLSEARRSAIVVLVSFVLSTLFLGLWLC